ncbi:hypothetical protein NDU88_004565 [Pleurodeles waltl]|uniref:Uncharacterized protein n=1 Tax=Pleurodeles waltl TaxID=8319 RepID=A0AAV7KYS1_PLEWA|nr:hypothetical protein NDU88_004565 [Pleurodeles waltl]
MSAIPGVRSKGRRASRVGSPGYSRLWLLIRLQASVPSSALPHGEWPGLRSWRSHESPAPEVAARVPRPSAPARTARALNHLAALPNSGRSGGTPASGPVIVAARAGRPDCVKACGPSSPSKPRPHVSSGPRQAWGELPARDGGFVRAPDFGGGTQRCCGGTVGPAGAPPEGAPRPNLEKRVRPCSQWGRPESTDTCPTLTP